MCIIVQTSYLCIWREKNIRKRSEQARTTRKSFLCPHTCTIQSAERQIYSVYENADRASNFREEMQSPVGASRADRLSRDVHWVRSRRSVDPGLLGLLALHLPLEQRRVLREQRR